MNVFYIDQLKDILPSILLPVFMGIVVYLFNLLKLSTVITLIIQIIVGGIVYISLAKLFKIDSFEYILDTIKGFKRKKN